MIDLAKLALLKGKKALVTGIANDQSIAWGCAKAFHAFGADLAITYRSEKTKRYVDPVVKKVDPAIYMPLDVQKPGELEAVFAAVKKKWGKLDIVLHSIAFAPKEDLQGGSSIAPRTDFSWQWSSHAGLSFGWPSWPSPS